MFQALGVAQIFVFGRQGDLVLFSKLAKFAGAMALAMTPLAGAHAATTVSAVAATDPYSGPTPTFDFDIGDLIPITGGTRYTTSVPGVVTIPFGTDGTYHAVGPDAGNPAVLSLGAFSQIGLITLSWGSVDTKNVLEVLDNSAVPNVIATITGTDIQGLVGTAGEHLPRGALVSLDFDDTTAPQVGALRFASGNNSFEFDNITIAPVPEPGVWAMMIIGFAAMGFALRRRRKTEVRVRFA